MKPTRVISLVLTAIVMACGSTSTTPPADESLTCTGTVQVLAQGTRSETLILEDTATGEFYALVGETSRELIRYAGSNVTVNAEVTEEGWSIRPELVKLLVLEYVIEADPDLPRGEGY